MSYLVWHFFLFPFKIAIYFWDLFWFIPSMIFPPHHHASRPIIAPPTASTGKLPPYHKPLIPSKTGDSLGAGGIGGGGVAPPLPKTPGGTFVPVKPPGGGMPGRNGVNGGDAGPPMNVMPHGPFVPTKPPQHGTGGVDHGHGAGEPKVLKGAAEEYLRGASYIDPIPPNSKGGAPLFVNIRSTKRDVTALFDGYNKDVPESNNVRGEECDSNTHQVYWYFKPSTSVHGAYTIEQRHTGWILTYPTTPSAGSPITVKETSNSLWEIRDGPEDWILSPAGTSLALTLSKDGRQVTLQYASVGDLNQQWWCQRSRS